MNETLQRVLATVVLCESNLLDVHTRANASGSDFAVLVADRVLHVTSDKSITQSSKYPKILHIFTVDEPNVELFHQ